jgi:hypothetical protein
MRGHAERTIMLVAKERPDLMAHAASDDVRVAEMGIGAKDGCSHFLLIGDEIVAAQHFAGRGAHDLSAR